MANLTKDHQLREGDRVNPLLWLHQPPPGWRTRVRTDDRTLAKIIPGSGRALKSWGHNEAGVHWLATRGGTGLHDDRAYLRYTHQLVLRNDGNRIRGLPEHDDPESWHPIMVPGTLYCLDTHSPHQGLSDTRVQGPPGIARVKVVIAVDREEPLAPVVAWDMLSLFLMRQLTDDPVTVRPPKWRTRA